MNLDCLCDSELYCVIMPHGMASAVIQTAKHHGISGATVLYGHGTIQSGFLSFLGLNDIRKEIILMAANRHIGDAALKMITEEYALQKPNKGIAFSIPLLEVIGSKNCVSTKRNKEEIGDTMKYDLIFTIVDRGNAEQVIDAATQAGSTGGTIINARGSGIHETQKIFNIAIEPEKEIVMILAPKDRTEAIAQSIRSEMQIDDPGKGIIFILDVTQTYGLYKEK